MWYKAVPLWVWTALTVLVPGKYFDYIANGDFSEYEFIPDADAVIDPATRLEGFLFLDCSSIVVQVFVKNLVA